MVRPVKCHFCKRRMYYSNDVRHEPEVRIDIIDGAQTDKHIDYFYAHKKCYRKYFLKKRHLFAETPHHRKIIDPKPEDA
jgi:hypothetical protein